MIRALHLRRLREQPLRTLVAIVAVAGGVALSTGVLIGRASVSDSVESFSSALSGLADLRVSGSVDQAGLPEGVLPELRAVPGVAAVVPFVVATTELEGVDGTGYVTVLGADCTTFPLCAPGGGLAAAPSLLAHARAGGVRTDAGVLPLGTATAVDGLEGLGGGRLLVLPLADAEREFARDGWVDVAYVTTAAGADLASVRAGLAAAAGPTAVVDDARASILDEDVIGKLLVGLMLTSLVGLTIGGQLVGNALALSFEERRRELATVAAVGAPPRLLARGVLVEAAVLGGCGGLLGAGLGVLVAAPAVAAIDDQLGRATGLHVVVHVPLVTVVGSLALGLGVALLAAVKPARRVARLDLAGELADRERHDAASSWSWRRLALAGAATAAGVAVGWLGQRDGSLAPWQPVAAVAGLVIAASAAFRLPGLFAHPVVEQLSRRTRSSGPARAALGALAGDPRRVTAITSAAAAAIALGVTLGGLDAGLDQGAAANAAEQAGGRVFVSALPINNGTSLDEKLSPTEEAAIAAVPGVESIQRHFNATIDDQALGLYQLTGEDEPAPAFAVLRGPDAADVLAAGQAVLGPALARDLGLAPGDPLVVPGREGPVPLVVGAVWAAPEGLGRSVTVNHEVFAAIAGPRRPSHLLVTPAPGVDPATLAGAIRDAGIRPGLVAADTETYGRLLGLEFHSFTAPFRSLQRALVVVVVVATTSTLLLAGIQRRREHALLSALGMTPAGLAATTLVEVALLGAIATVLGGVAGVVAGTCFQWASAVLTGLRIPMVYSPTPVLVVGLATTAAALVGAAFPAWRTSRIDPALALRYE